MGVFSILSSLFSMTTVYLGVTAIVLFLIYDYWVHTYFKRLGIPGPPPYPILGNAGDLSDPLYEVLDRYAKEYGPVVGMYLWRKPIILVSDLDMLKSIMVKDHHKFRNKPPLVLDSGSFDLALFLLRDSRWKRVRDIVTPTFTGKKMKMMSGIINENADTMVEKLLECCDNGGTLESQDLYGGFVMDTVASCGFGLKLNSQKNKDDPFVKNVTKFFEFSFTSRKLAIVSALPWLKNVFSFFSIYFVSADVIKFFERVTEKAVSLRESDQSEQRVDFLQLLIDAKNGQNETANENDDDDIHNKYFKDDGAEIESVQTKSQKYITREELIGQSMIFLIAGYETTATLLTLTSYLLATNPDPQDKLIAEIDDLAPKREDVNYTTISKMPYLDQVICEALRIYPPAAMTDRECGETCSYNGKLIEKGVSVWIPTFNIHRNPEYWPEPTKFDPDRFSKEGREGRNPFSWIPFGAGPRNCIGMRFALMESKMALVRTMQVVRFEVSPQTKIPPTLGRTGLLAPPDGITVKVVRR